MFFKNRKYIIKTRGKNKKIKIELEKIISNFHVNYFVMIAKILLKINKSLTLFCC